MMVRIKRGFLAQPFRRELSTVMALLLVVGASVLALAAHPAHPRGSSSSQPGASHPAVVPHGTISSSWYFAEGSTATGFSEYLTLANFNAVSASVTVTYYYDTAAPVTKNYTVAANARSTLTIATEAGTGKNVAMAISSTQPIVAERPMYFTFNSIPGGTDVLGATSLGTSYTIPYLDTSANHDNWLSILNSSTSSMTATFTYYPAAGGTPITATHTVAAQRRGTVHFNAETGIVTGAYYWATVSLSTAGLVERTLYLQETSTGYTGGGTIVGVTAPQTSWSFAEGFTSPAYTERYVVVNPGSTSTVVTLTLFKQSGAPVTTQVALAPRALQLLNVDTILGTGNVNNSAQVQATGAIYAERVISLKYIGAIGGSPSSSIPAWTETVGTPAPGTVFYFAEGFTGTGFEEFLSLLNPDPSTSATVQVTLQPAGGGMPITPPPYTVPAQSRFSVNISSLVSNQNISMKVQVTAGPSIVAERILYFLFGTSTTGADAVVGYQP